MFLAGALAIPLAALAVAGCGGGSSGGSASAAATTSTPSGGSATVDSASVGGLGTVLVDSQGRTLYLFQKDSSGKSACLGACATAWPPLRASGKPTVGSALYTFAGDQSAGQVTGQGSTAFGGSWFVLNTSGNQVTAQPSSTGSSSGSSGGGYGY
jgi:predicted lipoprotein with Yx(FWY)xxD motif